MSEIKYKIRGLNFLIIVDNFFYNVTIVRDVKRKILIYCKLDF